MRKYFLIYFLLIFLTGCNFKQKRHSDNASLLLHTLKESSDHQILFGQQDAIAYGINWKGKQNYSDIKSICGQHPAIVGFDLSNIGLKQHNIEKVSFEEMKKLIIWYNSIGGIISLSWHMRNPITNDYAWEREASDTMILKQILKNEKLNFAYLDQLNAIVDFLDDLKDKDGNKIPILFRPFHEANGNQFWWSSINNNADDFKNFWNYTCYYLKELKKQDQLLMVYSSDVFDSEKEFLEYYPGNKYTDILAFDDFHSLENPDTYINFKNRLLTIERIASDNNKIYAIGEIGNQNLKINNYFTGVLLKQIISSGIKKYPAYMLTWRSVNNRYFHIPDPGMKQADDLKKFCGSDIIKLLD